MTLNMDFLSPIEKEKIIQISKNKKQFLYQIGQRCEVKDKSFWSKIMSNKKPVPEHVRTAINNMFREEGLI